MYRQLIELGVAIAGETSRDTVLIEIADCALAITNAESGTFYLLNNKEDRLEFSVVINHVLDLRHAGSNGGPIDFAPLPLHHGNGKPNYDNISTFALLNGRTINTADAYEQQDYNFAGTRAFDQKTGYRTKSVLTVPMRSQAGDLIGVLQLINARKANSDLVTRFDPAFEPAIEAIAQYAGDILTGLVPGIPIAAHSERK